VANFVKVARVEDIQPGEKRIYEVDGILVVLVNLHGEFYAIEDTCTHDGGPLGEGEMQNGHLICPRHGARFDVRTGAALSLPAVDPTPIYEVRVQDGDIYVESY
jgi:3-phenylpropionate/trans-cinnamate dioxygenase ferredoxin component